MNETVRCRAGALLLLLLAGCGNRPPSDPVLLGPESGQPGETLSFRAWSVDPDGDDIAYRFDWGEQSAGACGPGSRAGGAEEKERPASPSGEFPAQSAGEWTPFGRSGDTFLRRRVYDRPGSYEVTVRARDRGGLESGRSNPLLFPVALAGPYPLGAPAGPDRHYPDSTAEFTARAGHVRGDSVSVQFDWDGTPGGWGEWVAPGSPARDSHRFGAVGGYQVRFRARDRTGNVSLWSAPLACTVLRRPLEPPRDLRLSTPDGTSVLLCWATGRNPEEVSYGLWFRALGWLEFKLIQSVTGDSVVHDPGGATGIYTVSALFEHEELFAADTLSTEPVYSEALTLYELNVDARSGYGWDQTGRARLLAMTDTASAAQADLYFTDRSPGSNGPAFYLSSPHLGPGDPGGRVPDGPWRQTGLGLLWNRPREPLPPYEPEFYGDLVDVGLLETWVAVYCASGRYALVHSVDPEPESARVRLRSWYQPVPGLRLLDHDAQR